MSHDEHLHEEIPILVLVDEDGVEHQFELVAEMELENETYRVLIPLEENEDLEEQEVEVVILKVVYDEEGTEFLSDIEDDTEWEKVADAWQELVESEQI
ncbi:hypothetical protein SYNTR_0313 [Candidatus Syntrophocurvum alkaliphilum]|uniref:UPF0473 protein SYNTR_0313 n=1 Tax=Candidatus Syntrophocurvum alkaliphilum TaxID=2293317 RepID=A0A6I6D6P3_9FIRM|nr:DUF1292 domain-containing protein [Candidatus Syntrophocurvum alkaliphilum]QGT98906.1 hypothetical protein SYNTR_0313 [Candidatus Syntrophocurvum alkaliphilum]